MIRKITLKRFKCFEDEEIPIPSDGVKLLAGPNNAGKSTILQSLVVWNFCVFAIREEKGDSAITKKQAVDGVGISYHNFGAINLPNFKHLWHNNKSRYPNEDTYTLSIGVEWEHTNGNYYSLTVALSLHEDRVYARVKDSTVDDCGILPEIVYLPPIAGLDANEPFATPAIRNAMLGKGLAGSILRNVLLDLQRKNVEQRNKRKEKFGRKELAKFRKTDPWERLQATLRQVFEFEIEMGSYNEAYHSTIRAYTRLYGLNKSGRMSKIGGRKDLMSEGSGALQWVCVCAYAVNPKTDILLLDEPDAHLHSSLQAEIMDVLIELNLNSKKQILISTHSTEILSQVIPTDIIAITNRTPTRITNDQDYIKLVSFLGGNVDRAELLRKVSNSRKVLFVEGPSDESMIHALANTLSLPISSVTILHSTGTHKDRRKLIDFLDKHYPGIKAISLRDLDDMSINNICKDTMRDKSDRHKNNSFSSRTLRRREIENYALVPQCIARVIGINLEDLKDWWESEIELPWKQGTISETNNMVTMKIKGVLERKLKQNGKELTDVWKEMKTAEIHPDLIIIMNQIHQLHSSADQLL